MRVTPKSVASAIATEIKEKAGNLFSSTAKVVTTTIRRMPGTARAAITNAAELFSNLRAKIAPSGNRRYISDLSKPRQAL